MVMEEKSRLQLYWPFHFIVTSVHSYASHVKQCYLILTRGRWRSLAGKVTAGLLQSSGSPASPADWLLRSETSYRTLRSHGIGLLFHFQIRDLFSEFARKFGIRSQLDIITCDPPVFKADLNSLTSKLQFAHVQQSVECHLKVTYNDRAPSYYRFCNVTTCSYVYGTHTRCCVIAHYAGQNDTGPQTNKPVGNSRCQ